MQHFTLQYLDDDQAIMWNGALEYGKGNFPEPYFFGQPYNTMLESFCAVPLIKAGCSYAFALTFIMSLFTLLPFIILSLVLFRKNQWNQALLMLMIPLLLPTEFSMLTAISRGAISGVFLAFFGIWALLSLKTDYKFLFFSLFSCLGMVANPNTLVLVLPLGILYFGENLRNKKFYLYVLAGTLLPALLWYMAGNFYKTHPEYVVHDAWPLNFDTGRLRPADWHKFFGYVTPLAWYTGLALFPALILFTVLSFRQKKKSLACAFIVAICLLLLALTSNKVHDGYDTVFYSCGRMFLAVPFMLACLLAHLQLPKRSWLPVCALAVVCFVIKQVTVTNTVRAEVTEKKEHNMFVAPMGELKRTCELINTAAKQKKATLLVVHSSTPYKHLINYACPCLIKDFPLSIEPMEDRRTWKLEQAADSVFSNILFTGLNANEVSEEVKKKPGFGMIHDSLFMFYIENNQIKTENLLREIGLPMRKH